MYYEGTTTVRRSHLDALASKLETILMEEGELVTEFSAKLSAIASEANVFGKKFKEKKLVKFFLRCLPGRFESHLSAINIALNTDTMKFSEVVGMIKAHEMDLERRTPAVQKGIALVVSEDKLKIQELENTMSLMVKKFDKSLKRFDRGSRGHFRKTQSGESS